MAFLVSNLALLSLALLTYVHFRCGVDAYCKLSKKGSGCSRKSKKGIVNFWFYSQLHKNRGLGVLYYFNLIYLFSIILFSIAVALSWIPFLRIPVMIIGVFLGAISIPVFSLSLIHTNLEDTGQAFVLFKLSKGYNGKSRRFITVFDWVFGFLPLAIYIICLTGV